MTELQNDIVLRKMAEQARGLAGHGHGAAQPSELKKNNRRCLKELMLVGSSGTQEPSLMAVYWVPVQPAASLRRASRHAMLGSELRSCLQALQSDGPPNLAPERQRARDTGMQTEFRGADTQVPRGRVTDEGTWTYIVAMGEKRNSLLV